MTYNPFPYPTTAMPDDNCAWAIYNMALRSYWANMAVISDLRHLADIHGSRDWQEGRILNKAQYSLLFGNSLPVAVLARGRPPSQNPPSWSQNMAERFEDLLSAMMTRAENDLYGIDMLDALRDEELTNVNAGDFIDGDGSHSRFPEAVVSILPVGLAGTFGLDSTVVQRRMPWHQIFPDPDGYYRTKKPSARVTWDSEIRQDPQAVPTSSTQSSETVVLPQRRPDGRIIVPQTVLDYAENKYKSMF